MRKLLVAGTVFAIGLSNAAVASDSSEIQQLKAMIEKMQQELQQVKAENQQLKQEIQELKGGVPVSVPKKKASFVSKTGKPVTFYGYFKIDASYSDSKAVGKDFILFALPENSNGAVLKEWFPYTINSNDNDFNINFKHSRFGLLIKTKENDYNIVGNFEFDFYGTLDDNDDNPNHAGIRVRKAWVQFGKDDWNIRAGLDWMLLTQLYPHLSNFPSGAMMGNIGYRIPQIRFTKLFKFDESKLTTQVAFDKVWGDPDPVMKPYLDTGANSGRPDVQGRIAYDFYAGGVKIHLGTIGHYGKEQVTLYGGDEQTLDTYSYGLEGAISPASWLEISGKIWKGKNLGGWYTGGIGQGVLFVYRKLDNTLQPTGDYYLKTKLVDETTTHDPVGLVDVQEIRAEGGWVEVTLKPQHGLVFHLGYGVDNPKDSDLQYNGLYPVLARLKNTMYYGNVFYKLTPSLGLMGEVLRVKTDYPEKDMYGDTYGDGTVNRFQGSILYFF
ncbi:hypothetical protein SAMN06265339_0524 [Desulfurobacterium pacificum]|uniref:Porin n=1 Tax=Desulfurobacterium pacificum TaxID=240166 RepID=A0ABY1NEV0_9BACT|nr:DcaP family trimeric outer membrane transporter [Desulfurobacterium pacificum]SMP07894.1 hypothetical protein SAMN06265339_0524 [Desulfurobacterium pacificum]